MVLTSFTLCVHHFLGMYHGDFRLKRQYGEAFEEVSPCLSSTSHGVDSYNWLLTTMYASASTDWIIIGMHAGQGADQHSAICCDSRWPTEASARLLERVAAGALLCSGGLHYWDILRTPLLVAACILSGLVK
jgi:hypothetical protein